MIHCKMGGWSVGVNEEKERGGKTKRTGKYENEVWSNADDDSSAMAATPRKFQETGFSMKLN